MICKVLDIIEDASHTDEISRCFIWEHEEESRQGPIGRTILQVEYDRSDGVCDILGAHGGETASDRQGCGGSDRRNRRYTV